MWRELTGTWTYAAGASGTVTLPDGAFILQIVAHSSGSASVAILGGTAVPLISGSGTRLQFFHTMVKAQGTNNTVVFTSTDSYFIEYVVPAH